jgi:hypothetical protein
MIGRRMTLRLISGNMSVTIPRIICRHFGIEGGTRADIYAQDGKIIIDMTTAEMPRQFGEGSGEAAPDVTAPPIAA